MGQQITLPVDRTKILKQGEVTTLNSSVIVWD